MDMNKGIINNNTSLSIIQHDADGGLVVTSRSDTGVKVIADANVADLGGVLTGFYRHAIIFLYGISLPAGALLDLEMLSWVQFIVCFGCDFPEALVSIPTGSRLLCDSEPPYVNGQALRIGFDKNLLTTHCMRLIEPDASIDFYSANQIDAAFTRDGRAKHSSTKTTLPGQTAVALLNGHPEVTAAKLSHIHSFTAVSWASFSLSPSRLEHVTHLTLECCMIADPSVVFGPRTVAIALIFVSFRMATVLDFTGCPLFEHAAIVGTEIVPHSQSGGELPSIKTQDEHQFTVELCGPWQSAPGLCRAIELFGCVKTIRLLSDNATVRMPDDISRRSRERRASSSV
ncbi:MAG: hypothetical protein LBB38_00910 [Puniceicoccales bacterium]|jgi:hypothetical protein|nr:hypothetical protein [Puniceicoccales bacterium]